ncbi:alpha/beta hydrolase [Marinobacter sp. X15-166B]|nr:alpha/beta hydrolase [Marinobacter sp. X15-166B]
MNGDTLISDGHPELPLLLFAHGAGAPMDSPVLERVAAGFAEHGVQVVRFEFPYMQQRRVDGRRRPPDRMPVLTGSFENVLTRVRGEVGAARPVFIGGKSMGGRVATHLSCKPEVAAQFDGVVCFGYPFHPPGKPERWRTGHFADLRRPLLVVQGTRDPFGKQDEVVNALDPEWPVELCWLQGGNHDFEPLKRQRETREELLDAAVRASVAFMRA